MNPTQTLTIAQPNAVDNLDLSEDDLVILQAAVPEKGKEVWPNTRAYWRALPCLLADGEEGRYALIHGGSIASLWDSLNDATQAGYEKFGDAGRFVTAAIKHLELERIRQFLAEQRAKKCHI
jgi:hypothetical protein